MNVRRVDDPAVFLAAAMPLLIADEARNNLLLGLAATLTDEPSLYPDYRLWLVEDGAEVVATALMTPPHNLVVAGPRKKAALDALAAAVGDDLPGVVGALPEVELFATAWAARTGTTATIRAAQGIYMIERVQPVTGVPGRIREATAADSELLCEWWRAFQIEAQHDAAPDDERIRHGVEHRLVSNHLGLRLWEHDGPVSFAGFGGNTPSGTRIGPVYTPPECRGRGYASSLVADLSASLLAAGHRFCFLYTDLANPTSNSIYRRIGYDRVCESAEIAFEPRA